MASPGPARIAGPIALFSLSLPFIVSAQALPPKVITKTGIWIIFYLKIQVSPYVLSELFLIFCYIRIRNLKYLESLYC
jgi:hypothetical protein